MPFYVSYLNVSFYDTLYAELYSFYDLEINLQIFSISRFLVNLTQPEFTKGKQVVKMFRFSLKACKINQ